LRCKTFRPATARRDSVKDWTVRKKNGPYATD
jgi:hypothetical protein